MTNTTIEKKYYFRPCYVFEGDGFNVAQTRGFDYRESQGFQNRNILKQQLSLYSIATVDQVHGSEIIHFTQTRNKDLSADGIIVEGYNVGLGITTADCYPVYIYDGYSLVALHCGWKGTFAGIIENALELIYTEGDTLSAFIGAGLCSDCFEVSADFIESSGYADLPHNSNLEKFLINRDDKYYYDLKGLIYDKLSSAGVKKIDSMDMCSSTDPDLYSHRAGDSERTLSVGYLVER